MHGYITGIRVMPLAHILQVQVKYSTPVTEPKPDTGIGIGASLILAKQSTNI